MSETPFITVLVPALNESERIEACLDSLADQTYPSDRYEVVIVDNGSHDETPELVRQRGVRLLEEPRRSAYWARNLGIENTRGDWIAFTDADCLAAPGWLENLLRCAEKNDATLVGGLIAYQMVTDTLGNRLLIETHQPDHLRANIEQFHRVAGGNMFVKRTMFEQLGLFDVIAWGSDIEYSQRVANSGFTVAFAEDAVVRHQCDLSSWEYWRRSYETRYGQVLLFDKRRGFGAAMTNIARLPWKPGLRSGRNRWKTDSVPPASFVSDWFYRWGNRWMEFFGEQVALLSK